MPEPVTVTRAELRELKPDGTEVSPPNRVKVQFNPETLKVSYANQVVPPANAGAQPQGNKAAIQYVGKGTTKLSVQLWFDVGTRLPDDFTPDAEDQDTTDVRKLTKRVANFIIPVPDKKDKTKFLPPGVRFVWGTFQFDGIMESLDESLEYFSPEGKPLRASMTLGLTQQEIQFQTNKVDSPPPSASSGTTRKAAGTEPLTQAPSGSNLPALADSAGLGDNWQAIALVNGIENPRLLVSGQLLDLNASSLSASINASASVSASSSASFSASASASTNGTRVSGSLTP